MKKFLEPLRLGTKFRLMLIATIFLAGTLHLCRNFGNPVHERGRCFHGVQASRHALVSRCQLLIDCSQLLLEVSLRCAQF